MNVKACASCLISKPHDQFYLSPTGSPRSYCKACTSNQRKERYARNRDKELEKIRAYNWEKSYGLTPEQYWQMNEDQNGLCASCGKPQPEHFRSDLLVVDHDHETGRVRQLLCQPCNVIAGFIELHGSDKMHSVLDYLNSHT